jgi:hypothetical protein
MTEQYKPSEQIKEQIAREYKNRKIDYPLTEAEAYIKADICLQLPTIRKALELYENQPQWQDKPDKEGWYCAMAKGRQCGWYWLYTPVNPVYVYKQKGALYLRKYDVEDFILKDYTLSEYLKRYKDYDGIKFLYLPEPEPYKDGE